MTNRCVITQPWLHARACAHLTAPSALPSPPVSQNCTQRSGAPRAANGDTLFYPWHHPPSLLLKKETNIHPEGTGDGERKKERQEGEEGIAKPILNLSDAEGSATETQPDREKGRYQDPETLDLFSSAKTNGHFSLSSREKLHRFLAGDDLGLLFCFFVTTRMNIEVSSVCRGKQRKEGCLN